MLLQPGRTSFADGGPALHGGTEVILNRVKIKGGLFCSCDLRSETYSISVFLHRLCLRCLCLILPDRFSVHDLRFTIHDHFYLFHVPGRNSIITVISSLPRACRRRGPTCRRQVYGRNCSKPHRSGAGRCFSRRRAGSWPTVHQDRGRIISAARTKSPMYITKNAVTEDMSSLSRAFPPTLTVKMAFG